MNSLLLTLGHNSSAALVRDGQLVWAYETERLSGVKSDSRFPLPVLESMGVNPKKLDEIIVSHWAPTCRLGDMSAKHWQPEWCDERPIYTLSPSFSHHDAHIHAAKLYAGAGFPRTEGTIGVVVDGFGVLGEHFSVYDLSYAYPKLLRRYRGYDTSLGLWYQYATAFMGMKMHEDEYKLLGYEVHAIDTMIDKIERHIHRTVEDWLSRLDMSVYGSEYDPVFDLAALPNTRDRVFRELNEVLRLVGLTDSTTFEARTILAYFVQTVLEQVVMSIVAGYSPKNLLLSGGVFLNVKLNLCLLDSIEGLLCVNPLAGDQGNAFGLYAMLHPQFQLPNHLFWGNRSLLDVGEVEGLEYFSTEGDALDRAADLLSTVGRVNLVRGAMEFGPRALCNTSTLALPTSEQVDTINRANNRNTVMPMAPVMSRHVYDTLFESHARRVWRSQAHMIVALEHKEHPLDEILGIAHRYSRPTVHHTSRPQVTSEPGLCGLLNRFGGMLINTSFNFHGKPIAYDMPSVIENHRLQRARDPEIKTLVVKNA